VHDAEIRIRVKLGIEAVGQRQSIDRILVVSADAFIIRMFLREKTSERYK
jgi:hypothetical protein